MDKEALTQYIVSQLGKHVSRDNLIFDICNRAGIMWPEASELVAQVEQAYKTRIAWRQSALFLVVSLGILIGGLWAAGGAFLYFFGLWQQGSFSLDLIALRREYVMVIQFGIGLAMIAGSGIGILNILWSLL